MTPVTPLDATDTWGDLLVSLPEPSPASLSTSGSMSSGEYSSLFDVGTIAGGGGLPRSLWFHEEMSRPRFCLGKVGELKFCVKHVVGDTGRSCGVLKHETKKFHPLQDFGYVVVADGQVLCQPALDTSAFTLKQLQVIKERKFKSVEWESIIESFKSGTLPEWFPKDVIVINSTLTKVIETDEEEEQDEALLLSPKLSAKKGGIFEDLPTLFFDGEDLKMDSDEVGEKEECSATWRSGVDKKLAAIQMQWSLPFAELEANNAVLVADLKNMYQRIKDLGGIIGVKWPFTMQTNTVYSLIAGLESQVEQVQEAQQNLSYTMSAQLGEVLRQLKSISMQKQDLDSVKMAIANTKTQLSNLDKIVEVFNKRFSVIRPVLMNIKNQVHLDSRESSGSQPNLDILTQRLRDLELRMQDKEDWNPEPVEGSALMRLESILKDQAAKIKILENRVVGEGIQMGNLCYQTFEELKLWVKLNVPKGRFGLFVDGHSFLEFFTSSGHLDTEMSAAAENHSEKAGYATYQETQVAGSFKNLFPAVFGKGGAANVDDSLCLPAISHGDKWNNGSTGLHHQLMRNMNDVSYELDSSIKLVLQDYSEAKQLAIDCVTHSKRFVIDLITFMSTEYAVWQQRGLGKREAWLIVCQIVRKIFEDLQSARISARSARDRRDIDFSTASFIYATLKCHGIMADYVKHQFHDHPAVSAVITRHLASNFVKPEVSGSGEKKVAALSSKVDALEAKVQLLLKDKNPKHNKDPKNLRKKGGEEEL